MLTSLEWYLVVSICYRDRYLIGATLFRWELSYVLHQTAGRKRTDSYDKLPCRMHFLVTIHHSLLLAFARAFEVNLPVLKSVYELTLAIKPHTLRDLKLRLKVELLLMML